MMKQILIILLFLAVLSLAASAQIQPTRPYRSSTSNMVADSALTARQLLIPTYTTPSLGLWADRWGQSFGINRTNNRLTVRGNGQWLSFPSFTEVESMINAIPPVDLSDYVTLSTNQQIEGTKTFLGNIFLENYNDPFFDYGRLSAAEGLQFYDPSYGGTPGIMARGTYTVSSSQWSKQGIAQRIESDFSGVITANSIVTMPRNKSGVMALLSDIPASADLSLYQLRSEKGSANGYASLGSDTKIPIGQLPDLTTTTIAEGTNKYYTESRVSANTDVAANTAVRHNPITIGTANGLSLSTQTLSLGLASTSTIGALSSTDWNTFNNKQAAGSYQPQLNGTGFVKASGTTITYDNSTYEPAFAKNTAFNKNFGGIAGTVVQGDDDRVINGQAAFNWGNHAGLYPTYNGTGATGTWGINISGNSATTTLWGGRGAALTTATTDPMSHVLLFNSTTDGLVKPKLISEFKTEIGLGDGSTLANSISGNAATVTNGELTTNKQNSLTTDGTGIKYPTVDAVNTGLGTKQATLVSGTNIKTVNGTSLLGSGDITTDVSGLVPYTGATTNVNLGSNTITSSGGFIGNASTSTTAGTVTTAAQPSITSVGTLTGLTVTAPIVGSVTGNAATATNGVVTTGSYADPAWVTSLAYGKLTGAPTVPTDANLVHLTGNETKTGRLTLATPTAAAGAASIAPLIVTGGKAGANTATTGTVTSSTAPDINITAGAGGDITGITSGTALSGSGAKVNITGGDGGNTLGTPTSSFPGSGGPVIFQGGGSYGGIAGAAQLKAGNNYKVNGVGGDVWLVPGWGNAIALDDQLYNGTIWLGNSPGGGVRGNTVVGAVLDDRINRFQVTGKTKLTGNTEIVGELKFTNYEPNSGDSIQFVFDDTMPEYQLKGKTDPTAANLYVGGYLRAGSLATQNDITAGTFKLITMNTAPASSTATGILGQIRITADYIYICVATNTWKRVAISTW